MHVSLWMAAYEPSTRARRSTTPWWASAAAVLAIVGAIGIGIYLARTNQHAVTPLPSASNPSPGHATAPVPSSPQHPIDQAQIGDAGKDAVPMPPLEASDATVAQALASLFGGEGLSALLNPEHVVQRIVATIDSLPRQKLAPAALPIRGAQGAFETQVAGDKREIAARNAERYAPYATIARAIDAKQLVAWYVHAYPLFQQAYRELGYPDGYFNDRLIVVIDHLLATPDLKEPVALVQPNVAYEFADPALESRSAGQKLLLRSGPENEAIIKAKLREIRAALTNGEGPPPASSTAPEHGGSP